MSNQEQPSIDGSLYGERSLELMRVFSSDLQMPRNRAVYFAQTACDLTVRGELSDEFFFRGEPAEIRKFVDEFLASGEDTGDGSTNLTKMIKDADRAEHFDPGLSKG